VNEKRIELKISTKLTGIEMARVEKFLVAVGKDLQESNLGMTYRGSIPNRALLENDSILIGMHDGEKRIFFNYFERNGGKYVPPKPKS
jgi:hypothetical protein